MGVDVIGLRTEPRRWYQDQTQVEQFDRVCLSQESLKTLLVASQNAKISGLIRTKQIIHFVLPPENEQCYAVQ